ncbi:hypothetical protein BKA81DRAFT_352731 [Phyllosticta paracitricarpa]
MTFEVFLVRDGPSPRPTLPSFKSQPTSFIMSPPSNYDAHSSNPTQLGDPISLKAETSNNNHYLGARSTWTPNRTTPSKLNKTMLGDPVSLKAEKGNHRDPVDHDNGPSGSPGASQRMSRL